MSSGSVTNENSHPINAIKHVCENTHVAFIVCTLLLRSVVVMFTSDCIVVVLFVVCPSPCVVVCTVLYIVVTVHISLILLLRCFLFLVLTAAGLYLFR